MPVNYASLNNFQRIDYIFQNIQLPFVFIGFIGNILVFCVYSRRRLRNYSYSFYCRVMAVCDNLTFIRIFGHWVRTVLGIYLNRIFPLACRLNEYQANVTAVASFLLLTVILIDRIVTLFNPDRFLVFKKRWFQVLVVFIAFIYSSALSVIMPIYNKLEVIPIDNSSNMTEKICILPPLYSGIHMLLLTANTLFIHGLVNLILNMRMILFVRATRFRFAANLSQANRHAAIRERTFAINSIGLNLCSLACKLPFTIGLMVAGFRNLDFDQVQMVITILLTFAYLDNAAVLFINLRSNSIFYREFSKMFTVLSKNFFCKSSTNNLKIRRVA